MRFDKKYLFPECPVMDCSCPYLKKSICNMFAEEQVTPYLECDAWDGSDEAEELISKNCMLESAGWY